MLRGRIVLVPFPFDDLSSAKVRPAVCLTEPLGSHNHVVIAFISSKIPQEILETDLLLSDDFLTTGLKVQSVLRLHRLVTISDTLFQRELGDLPTILQEEADKRLKKLFGLQ